MKFGVRECADIAFKAKSAVKIGSHVFKAGEPVLYLDTAKTSTIETSATTVYATGGRGNARLLAWEGEKVLTFTVEDALISDVGLAVLTGADLIYANGTTQTVKQHATQTILLNTENFKVATNEITITGDAIYDKGDTYLMLLDPNGEMSGVPVKATSVTGNKITVAADLFKVGDTVLVDYYIEHKTDAFQVDITPDKFAGYYYVEGSTLYRRQMDGVDLPAELIIPKVKIQSAITLTMASSGDPSTFTFTMDAFPDYTKFDPTKKVLCSIQVIGADDNFDKEAGLENEGTLARYNYNDDVGENNSYLAYGRKTNDDTDKDGKAEGEV